MQTLQFIESIIESASFDFGEIFFSHLDESTLFFKTNIPFEENEIVKIDMTNKEKWLVSTRLINQNFFTPTNYFVNPETFEFEEIE